MWVVVYHIDMSQGPLHGRLGRIVEHGAYGVDIFFVLSGMVLSLVYAGNLPERFQWSWYRRFLSRRFAKIYPLHVITFCVSVALVLAARHFHYNVTTGADNTRWAALCSLLLVHSFGLTRRLSWNGPSWSVSAEWFAYSILFAPMVFLLRRVRVVYVAGMTFVLIAAAMLWRSYAATPWTELTTNGAVRIAPEFLGGYLVYRLVYRGSSRGRDLWTLSGILLLLLTCCLRVELPWLLIASVMMLLAGLYRGGGVADWIFGSRLGILLGDASYSIYMIQSFVIIAANQLLRRVHVPEHTPLLLAIAGLETAAVALAGVITFRCIEEPIRQALLRFLLGPAPPNPEALTPPALPGFERDTQVSSTIS